MKLSASFLVLSGALALLPAGPAGAQGWSTEGDPDAGRTLAVAECSACHVVTRAGGSPPRRPAAPSFEVIAKAAETTPAGLRAFLATPHDKMPDLILTPQETSDVIAYIMSLRERR